MTKILQIDREAAKRLDKNAERAGLIKDPQLLFPKIAAEHLAFHREQATRELVIAMREIAAIVSNIEGGILYVKPGLSEIDRISSLALTKATTDA